MLEEVLAMFPHTASRNNGDKVILLKHTPFDFTQALAGPENLWIQGLLSVRREIMIGISDKST